MTFFGPSMTEKTVVEARGRKISGSSQLKWEVGGRVMRVSLIHIHVCVRGVGSNRTRARHWALTEPEHGPAGYALLNPSDRSMAVN